MDGINRREMLRVLGACGLTQFIPGHGLQRLAFGVESEREPVIVLIHLRGGCDGLHLISPSNDPDFIAARPASLRVISEGKDAGFHLEQAIAPKIDFRLHNAAAGLYELYQAKHLGFVHAAGITDSTRSHFVATDIMAAGVGSQKELMSSNDGWFTRYINGVGNLKLEPGQPAAISLTSAIPGEFRGLDSVIDIPDFNKGIPEVGTNTIRSFLWSIYATRNDELGVAGRRAIELPLMLERKLERGPDGKVLSYHPENGAEYGKAGGLAESLTSVARLIKMQIGLKAVTLDYGSWDTHEAQAGRFRTLVEPLSNGLSNFWNDISAHHQRVVVIVLTEFGRRFRSNRSEGTDHGRASIMGILGGQVRGGNMLGVWPGLRSDQLESGVDLSVTTDYRSVLSEILGVSGHASEAVFSKLQTNKKLGIMKSR